MTSSAGGPRGRNYRGAFSRPRARRPALSPDLVEEDRGDHSRQRVPPSPLKRLEGEEKEIQRRSQPVHVGLRLTVMGFVVLGLFSMMIVRLWSLQVLQGPAARQYESSLSTRTVLISPPRGLILSRTGTVLVGNKVMSIVTLNRQAALNDPGLIERLAVALGITPAQINADLNDQQDSLYEPVPVAVAVSTSTILYLSVHRSEFPGVTISYVAERTYPKGDLGVQMLGYVADITASQLKVLAKDGYLASDVIGQSGVEAQYERFLRGKSGKQVLEVDSLGDPVGTQSLTPPTPGDDVILNIDVGLEEEVQRALGAQLANLRASGLSATSGAGVVLDPQNGAVLAMVSLPSYNPQWWVGGMSTAHWADLTRPSAQDPLLNRAIAGAYQPGSTFKLATATAALQDGIITPSTLIYSPGTFTLPNCSGACTFHSSGYESCGQCNIVTAIAMSDDVFFYNLGYDFFMSPRKSLQLGIQREAALYGFGKPTGVDLPGEYPGQVDGPALRQQQHAADPAAFPSSYYGPGDALETAFGQGETLVTPLQIANAFSTFANGGTRYAPEVAAAIASPTGKVVKIFKPKVLGHVKMSTSTYDTILTGLQDVVKDYPVGTASGIFLGYHYSAFPLAGKTGTATTSSVPGAQPTAVFVAFGPATGPVTAPKYCVVVVIPGAGYGDAASAPVVRQIFQYLISHPVPKLNLHPLVGG